MKVTPLSDIGQNKTNILNMKFETQDAIKIMQNYFIIKHNANEYMKIHVLMWETLNNFEIKKKVHNYSI